MAHKKRRGPTHASDEAEPDTSTCRSVKEIGTGWLKLYDRLAKNA